jgi:hypothetical protein
MLCALRRACQYYLIGFQYHILGTLPASRHKQVTSGDDLCELAVNQACNRQDEVCCDTGCCSCSCRARARWGLDVASKRW